MDSLKFYLFLAVMLLAMAIAGALDYEDERAEQLELARSGCATPHSGQGPCLHTIGGSHVRDDH